MKKKLLLQDFSDYLVKSEGISKRDADSFVRSFFEVIEKGLLEDKFVKIKGFGTFKLVSVSERESVNINTGERFKISEHTKISFTPDTTMKELVNRPFAHFEAVDLNDDTDMKEFEIVDEEMQEEEEENTEDTAEACDDDTTNEASSATSAPTTNNDEESATVPHTTEPMPIVSAEPDSSPTQPSAQEGKQEIEQKEEEQQEQQQEEQQQEEEQQEEETTSAQSASQPEQAQQPAPSISATKGEKPSQSSADEEIVVTPTQPIITPQKANNQQHENHSTATVGYTYTEAPMPRKRNWWKTSALILGIILLMLASYFAGYFRIFCPCSLPIIGNTWDANAPATPAVENPHPTPSVQPNDSIQPQRTDSVQRPTVNPETQPTPPSVPSQPEPTQPSQVVEKPQPAPTPKTASPKPAQENARPATHRVKMGDNVYRISRRYYGSDKYAQKIIEANHLKDANTITVGMDLKLP